ncbi:Dipeptide-binding ABC transporter, periplasmic substrate-binding component (TC 3.A.1.5.2) [Klebsiella pneumoniae ISC21]|nr:Dipeptide-binding ABC transporter, periplasmic substrate-binding component (TC 3.A.1.5.2) [Klebsiella pneumoniae ISC21]
MALRLSSLRPGRPDKPKMPPSGNMYPTVQANRDMKKTSLLGACILALAMSMGSGEAVAKNAARPADHRHEYE